MHGNRYEETGDKIKSQEKESNSIKGHMTKLDIPDFISSDSLNKEEPVSRFILINLSNNWSVLLLGFLLMCNLFALSFSLTYNTFPIMFDVKEKQSCSC